MAQDDAKMAKSVGEFLRLASLTEKGFDASAYRYFCMTAHYRTQMSFSWESLQATDTALQRLYQLSHDWGEPGQVCSDTLAQFTHHINDDLNLPRAIAVIWDMVKTDLADADKKATLIKMDEVLGLGIADWQPKALTVPADVMALVEQREQARKDRDFARADALRTEVEVLGFQIEDTREGPKVTG